MSIQLLLVDDDPFWRDHIAGDLLEEPGMNVVAAASSMEEALEAAARFDIDVILMDLNLTENNLDGLDAAAQILALPGKSHIKVIILTSVSEKDAVLESFRVGALNYINKSSYKDIRHAITEAYAGRASIHFDAARFMRSEVQLMELTPMERQVFELRRNGFSIREISLNLHKSVNTIKTQLRSIKHKIPLFKSD